MSITYSQVIRYHNSNPVLTQQQFIVKRAGHMSLTLKAWFESMEIVGVLHITPGSRAGLEPRSGGKSVAVQPIVKFFSQAANLSSLH